MSLVLGYPASILATICSIVKTASETTHSTAVTVPRCSWEFFGLRKCWRQSKHRPILPFIHKERLPFSLFIRYLLYGTLKSMPQDRQLAAIFEGAEAKMISTGRRVFAHYSLLP